MGTKTKLNDIKERLSPLTERLTNELAELEWSERSKESFMEMLASIREEHGPELLETVVWFYATVALRRRLPNDEEAAELGFAVEGLERVRTAVEATGLLATDVVH